MEVNSIVTEDDARLNVVVILDVQTTLGFISQGSDIMFMCVMKYN